MQCYKLQDKLTFSCLVY